MLPTLNCVWSSRVVSFLSVFLHADFFDFPLIPSNQDKILRTYENSLRMSIPLAFATTLEEAVELEDSIASLTQRLAQVERSNL
jgi:hypothetical protein